VNENKLTKLMGDFRSVVSKSFNISLEQYLVNLGFNIEKCGFCEDYSQILMLDLEIIGNEIFIKDIFYRSKNPYICRSSKCPSKKLNPNSIERVMKSNKISKEQARELIHSRNKSPFYKENHLNNEDFLKWQKRDKNYFIKKYGTQQGESRFKYYCDKISYKNSKERYVLENNIEKFIDISNLKAITLKNMIRVHSKDGELIYSNWKNKIANTQESFVRRYGEDEGINRYQKYKENLSYS